MQHTYGVTSDRVVNIDQTSVCMLPHNKRGFSLKGQDARWLADDKRQITVVPRVARRVETSCVAQEAHALHPRRESHGAEVPPKRVARHAHALTCVCVSRPCSCSCWPCSCRRCCQLTSWGCLAPCCFFSCYWWPVLLSGVAALWILVTRLPSSDAVRRASA